MLSSIYFNLGQFPIYFWKMSKTLNFMALFSVELTLNRAHDEKFGKNGGISQIFEFYCIFITKFFQNFSKKP